MKIFSFLRSGAPSGPSAADAAEPSIYGFIWRTTRASQITLVLMALMVVPFTIVPLELQKRIIDQGILKNDVPLLLTLLAVYAGIAALQALLLYVLNVQEGRVHEVAARRLRHRVMALIGEKRKGGAAGVRPGTVVSVYTSEVDPVGEFAGQAISVPIVEGGIFLSIMGYMVFTQPLLAAVALAFFAPQLVLVPVVQFKINQRTSGRIRLLRRASEETLSLLDRRPGGRFPFVAMATRLVYGLRIDIYRLKYLMKYVVLFLIFSARIAVLGVGGYMVMNGDTGIGVIVAFLSGLERLTARWNELVHFFRRMSDARLKYELILDILHPRKPVAAL